MAEQSAEKAASAGHGYGVDADCLCGRNFSKVRGLREHLTKARRQHHPRCYQNTGVPDDLPADLCDCRVFHTIERSTPPAPACDCDYWDNQHRFHCATNYPPGTPQ